MRSYIKKYLALHLLDKGLTDVRSFSFHHKIGVFFKS